MSEPTEEELIEHTRSVADQFGPMFRDSRKYGIWLNVITQSSALSAADIERMLSIEWRIRSRLRLLRQTTLERRRRGVWRAPGGYRRPLIGRLA